MAVVILFRAAVLLTPTLTRMVQSGQPPPGQEAFTVGKALWDRLRDPGEDDAALGEALSEVNGYAVWVATFDEPFELRKLQARWGRTSGMVGGDDDAVTTHHFLYAPSGTPSDTWTATQFGAVETAYQAFWTTMKSYFTPSTSLKQFRWYKAGPEIAPPQIPVRILDVNVAGTGSDVAELPPQVAISITEKHSDPKSWGRWYLPPMNSLNGTNVNGRLVTATQTALANAVDTLYEACVSASVLPVVYSAPKPVRQTAAEKRAGTTPGSLPAVDGRAIVVTQIQIDDVLDVIRSRRWERPLLREQRDIAGT